MLTDLAAVRLFLDGQTDDGEVLERAAAGLRVLPPVSGTLRLAAGGPGRLAARGGG